MRLPICALLVGACQPRAAAPPPPPQPVYEVPRGSGGDLERWICEHTSWTTSPDRQREARAEQDREDRELVERRAHQRSGGTETTHLTVELLDDYAWLPHRDGDRMVAERCTGVPPYHVEVLLDGVPRGAVDIPCMEGFQAPPRGWRLPAFDVPPGVHRLRVREVAHAISDTRDLVFPQAENDMLLDHVTVWCAETRFSIGDLTGFVMRL